MKDEPMNEMTSAEGEMFQQIEMSLDPQAAQKAPARMQEHMRRLSSVGGLSETDRHRSEKTEYVMRMLVTGRAPLGEPPGPAAPEPQQQPKRPAAPEPPPKRSAAPEPPPRPKRPSAQEMPKVMTLENLTFDDLLAELENV